MDGVRQICENSIINSFLIFLVTVLVDIRLKAIGHTALSNRLDRISYHFKGRIFIPSSGSRWFSKASVICEKI